LHPQTAEYLQDRGVFDDESSSSNSDAAAGSSSSSSSSLLQHYIFQDFFLDILPLHLVLRIMDIYTLEGVKVLFRIGVSLCVLYRREAAEQLVTISNASEWWQTMRHWAHYKSFNFNVVLRKAYGVHGKVLQNQLRFPSRAIIHRIIKAEEEHLFFEQQGMNSHDDEDNHSGGMFSSSAGPLGLATGPVEVIQSGLSNSSEIVQRVLAAPLQTRQLLANWVPLTMRLTNLDLIYSTNYHGRDLDIFFSRVKNARHSILLAEVLQTCINENSNDDKQQQQQQQQQQTIIGMYASQAWRVSNQVYGDGECFLFRISPNPQAWKWSPDKEATRKSLVQNKKNNNPRASATLAVAWDSDNSNNADALLHQYMVSTMHYISMGGNVDGSCGLRINEDLTRGESSTAAGFGNEPLHGTNRGSVFELGLVEVYGFVRQIDGKPV
jgi:TLD